MINEEKEVLGRHIECRYTTQKNICVNSTDVVKKIQTCATLYNKSRERFFEKVQKVLIVIAYKNWKEFDKKAIPDDWKVFVISKEFFNQLYGPTLNNLAQYYQTNEM